MHTKKQRLLFFLVLDKYIDNMFLIKLIEKLKNGIPQEERQLIQDKAEEIDLDQDENMLLLLALFYCLHVQTPKEGYMSMFTKDLIDKSYITFEPEQIKETNQMLRNTMDKIGIPLDYDEDKPKYVENIEYYIKDFARKYPNSFGQ